MAAPPYHVILAGGSGTRFWPASRKDRPKQFLNLAGPDPMIRRTFERCAACGPRERIFVSAGRAQREAVLRALPDLAPERFIGEPQARNTAAAVGLSALRLSLLDPEAAAVFCPADHVFEDGRAYGEAIAKALEAARAGPFLVTLGITPRWAETGYGYIETAGEGPAPGVLLAARFIEKPDASRAAALSSSGRHSWNSGVFVWRAASILEAISRWHPVLGEGLSRIRVAAAASGPGIDPLAGRGAAGVVEEVFAAQPSVSIDVAVMEKASDVLVVPCDPGWSDVGSWDAIAALGGAAGGGNVFEGEVVTVDARGCYARSEGRLVALVGVSDLIVVETADAVLVCRRGESQKVREVVAELVKKGRGDLT